MADTVTVKSKAIGSNELMVVLTCISDGSGESGVVKVDKSALSLGGVEPDTVDVLSVSSSIQGFTSVVLKFDNGTDETIVVLGTGSFFEIFGDLDALNVQGLRNAGDRTPGDIILTSNGAAAGATYTIVLRLKLVNLA